MPSRQLSFIWFGFTIVSIWNKTRAGALTKTEKDVDEFDLGRSRSTPRRRVDGDFPSTRRRSGRGQPGASGQCPSIHQARPLIRTWLQPATAAGAARWLGPPAGSFVRGRLSASALDIGN